ncbi:MAG TPA: tagaturonate reductase, partial [Rhodothermales bacterium]|nr:tagaturonate reductase [Rhodothermales bacterium]
EVGIVLDEEDRIDLNPPRSFPGKLTAALFERARAFDFEPLRGLVVLPCELVERNGDTLRDIVLDLASRWGLGRDFTSWVAEANTFCNTLVDRIVPGTPGGADALQLESRLGYHDALLTVAEPYRLWAIEGDDAFARRFPLTGVDPGLVVTDNIEPFRDRKVRILNGTHTAMVPAAILAGLKTVSEAIQDPEFNRFIENVAIREIVPTLTSDPAAALRFGRDVLERFANPFIRHNLIDITFQQTSKLRVRVLPTLTAYTARFGSLPKSIVLGLAAFILYHHQSRGRDAIQVPKDDAAEMWERLWEGRSASDAEDVRAVVEAFAGAEAIWGLRLDSISGLVEALVADILAVQTLGIRAAVEHRSIAED